MDTKTIQCHHCRQRLSIKRNETIVKCPACKLVMESSSSSPPSSYHNKQKGLMQQICPRGNFRRNMMMKKIRNDQISLSERSLNNKPFSSPSLNRPSKRAVLCGVSYGGGKFKLKGTINDVKNMRDMLINSFQFPEEGIFVLTEEEKEEMYAPTKKNIKNALEWLVKDCRHGDSLVFYFSGHGLRQPDFDGDETDGFDETICPADFLQQGMIVDNDINSIIVRPLKKGVTLHAIVDACHSGTILDLEYVYNKDKQSWQNNKPPSRANKATNGGTAICLSACQDNQLASDTTAFTGNTMNGVLTYILVEIVKQYRGLSYKDLLDMIYERIEQLKQKDCLMNTSFFRRFFKDKLLQKPTLSSSGEFDVFKTHFIL